MVWCGVVVGGGVGVGVGGGGGGGVVVVVVVVVVTPARPRAQDDEYMLVEKAPLVTSYISGGPCNCAAFTAGIVRGVLESAQFPADVSAHEYEDGRTAILIKFAPEVVEREKRIS